MLPIDPPPNATPKAVPRPLPGNQWLITQGTPCPEKNVEPIIHKIAAP